MKREFIGIRVLRKLWLHGWIRISCLPGFGKIATLLAACAVPPHKAGTYVASISRRGYVAPTAEVYHSRLQMGDNVFIGDRVIIYQARNGGPVSLADRVCILRDSVVETGFGGSVEIGRQTWIHPRCQINGYVANIIIGERVQIAPNCSMYCYDHGMASEAPIYAQPLQSKGDIIIEDEAWLGVGSIVLSGVRIGRGAVVGAGSVVTKDVPSGSVVAGAPARIVRYRDARPNSEAY